MGAAPESAIVGSHRSCFATTEGHWGRGSLPTAADKSDVGEILIAFPSLTLCRDCVS